MKYLMEQAEFETLIGRGEYPNAEVPPFTIVYFTAAWCGACRSIDLNSLTTTFPTINWLKCDVDQNQYTPGYCAVRSIPTFLAIKNKKIIDRLQSNDTDVIEKWVMNLD
jgi:thioredoxin-like negative regulator of GroEL